MISMGIFSEIACSPSLNGGFMQWVTGNKLELMELRGS